jgi:hypothetical protein
MWLLLQDEGEGGNAVNALLPLLVLGKRIMFEQPLETRLCDDAYKCYELLIRLVGVRMLEELLYQFTKADFGYFAVACIDV